MLKNVIETKLKELATQKEQLVAQVNAICGAEQVLNELLLECDKEDDTKSE